MTLKEKGNKLILSSKIKLIDQNTNKTDQLKILQDNYVKSMRYYLNLYWEQYNLDRYNFKKEATRQYSFYPIKSEMTDSILSARMLKCAQTQVMAMIKSRTSKLNKLYYKLELYQKESHYQNKSDIIKLQKLIQIERSKITKPYISDNTPMELSSLVFGKKINHTSFDNLYQLSSIWSKSYKKEHNLTNKINLLVNSHSHNNKLKSIGKEMTSFLVSSDSFQIRYKITELKKSKTGNIAAIDQGISYCVTLVDNSGNIQQSTTCEHNHTLSSILKQMSKKKKGSNNFRRKQSHRTNYVNWSINQLDLSGIKEIRLESLFDMTRNRKTSRFLSSFPYKEIRIKLQRVCQLAGVQLIEQSNMYRSQRCSCCGFVKKDNRKGDVFCCLSCGHTSQSDVNAAKNHLVNISEITSYNPLSHTSGFYWN